MAARRICRALPRADHAPCAPAARSIRANRQGMGCAPITNERMAALTRQIAADRRVIEAYTKEYELGQRSLIDLLNAYNQLFNARVSLETTKGAAVFADYQLLAAMGQLVPYLKAPTTVDAKPLQTRPLGIFPMKLPPVLVTLPEPGSEPLNIFGPGLPVRADGANGGALRAYAASPAVGLELLPEGSFQQRWPVGQASSWFEIISSHRAASAAGRAHPDCGTPRPLAYSSRQPIGRIHPWALTSQDCSADLGRRLPAATGDHAPIARWARPGWGRETQNSSNLAALCRDYSPSHGRTSEAA